MPKFIVDTFSDFNKAEKPLSADAVVTGIVARIVNSFRMFVKTRNYNFGAILMRSLAVLIVFFYFLPAWRRHVRSIADIIN